MSMNETRTYLEDAVLQKSHFGVVDYVILVLVLVVSLVVGIASGWRRSSTTKEFLTGGKDMNPAAICLSLLGGVISAISVQGNSTETYMYGTQLWMLLLGSVWGSLIVMFLILPVFYPLNLVSVCEYLEMRFQSSVLKKLASLTMILNNFIYLGVCLYAPSLALSAAINLPTFASLVILGVICAVYISLGGVRAVVYTDVVQTLMMFIGVLVVVVQVTGDIGGLSQVWNIAKEGGRLQFFNMDPNPFVRHTFWSVQVMGMQFVIAVVGISQAQYQRLVSVKSLRMSQGLVVAFTIGLLALCSLFYFSGLVAYAAYVDCDPVSSGKIEKADQILPYLVGDKLSHLTGMVGVFISAVAGAVLSSLSSQASCMVVLLWEDFLSGWWIFAKVSPGTATKITKLLSSAMVLLAIFSALIVAKLGTIFQVAGSLAGALMGPFSGIFIMAITAPWVNSKGAISGFVVAIIFNVWLVLGQFINEAGRSERLSLSIDGCLTDRNLSSLAYNVSDGVENDVSVIITNITTIIPSEFITESSSGSNYLRLYDISYCYLGSIGVLIVFVISSIVSFFTGIVKPSEVDPKLVNGWCFRIYCWMYGDKADTIEVMSCSASPNHSVGVIETELDIFDGHLSDRNGYLTNEHEKARLANGTAQNGMKIKHVDDNQVR